MPEGMKERIIEFIRSEYVEDPSQVITETTPLISSGLVDSFSMVSLKLFLEEEYGIKLSDAEASTETFDSVKNIMALVDRKIAGNR